jgi:hypothetical protein
VNIILNKKTAIKIQLLTSNVEFNDVVLFTESTEPRYYNTGFGRRMAIPITDIPSDIDAIMHILIRYSMYKINPDFIDMGDRKIYENIIILMKQYVLNQRIIDPTHFINNPQLYFNRCKEKIIELLELLDTPSKESMIEQINLITYDNINDDILRPLLESAEKLVNDEIINNILLQHEIVDPNIPFIVIVGERHLEDIRLKLSGTVGNTIYYS